MATDPEAQRFHSKAGRAVYRHEHEGQTFESVQTWGAGYPFAGVPSCASCDKPFELVEGDDVAADLVDELPAGHDDDELRAEVEAELRAEEATRRRDARKAEIRAEMLAAREAETSPTQASAE